MIAIQIESLKKGFYVHFFKRIKIDNGKKKDANMLLFTKIHYICSVGD